MDQSPKAAGEGGGSESRNPRQTRGSAGPDPVRFGPRCTACTAGAPQLPREAISEDLTCVLSLGLEGKCANPPSQMQPLPTTDHRDPLQQGSACGLSAEVKNKIASKCDYQAEDLRNWIEVTGMSAGTSLHLGLKNGTVF